MIFSLVAEKTLDSCEHPLLYLSGPGRYSPEKAISGSCPQALVGIHKSVWFWWLFMRWIPRQGSLWMVIPSVSAALCLSNSFHGYFVPILKRIEVSTLGSSFLSFMCFLTCIWDILSFWVNIHLSVCAHYVCSFGFFCLFFYQIFSSFTFQMLS